MTDFLFELILLFGIIWMIFIFSFVGILVYRDIKKCGK